MKRAMFLLCLLLCVSACREEPEMAPTIDQVKKEYEQRLLALPHVVSVGVGLDAEGRAAIIVGLEQASPATEERIRQMMGEYPVLSRVIGPVRAQ